VDLASGASATYTVTVIAPPSGSMTNVASGSSATPDPDPTNNNGTKTNSQVITFVQPLADVAVSKTGSASVPPGGLATYTLTVTNGGPSTASNVMVFDQLPASYTFVSAVPAPASTSGGLVRWPLFNLAAFARSNFSLTVISMISGVFTNIAYATNSTPDPDPTNNNGTKTGLASVFAGGLATYTLTVTNSGPSTATNVVTADTLPAGATFSSASGSTTLSNGVVRWAAVDLASGASATYTVTVIAPPSGSMTNVASGSSATPDPDPTNNNGTGAAARVVTSVVPGQFGVRQGPNILNPQSGLFEQRVTVTNVSSLTVAAFRLLVGNINGTNGVPRTNVTLVNATGTNVDSRPYVQYNSALDPGSNVTVILEFFVPDRKPFTNSIEVVATLPTGAGTNAGAGVLSERAFMDLRFAEPRFVIEWTSVPGTTYTIIYSDVGPSGPWLVATPTVTAANNRMQWYDDGPPKTASKPASVSSRYYRVIANP